MMTEPKSMIKVFVTDDHIMVVEGLRSLLTQQPHVEWLGYALHADDCMKALETVKPNVVLLDINMPGKDGIDLCLDVKKQYPSVNVIGLSSFHQLSYVQKMLDNGASGYVLKNASVEELMEAMLTVVSGKTYISDQLSLQGHATNIPVLTRREREVLNLIADGLTNNEIAEKLFISQTTVETHRKNLLLKFETKNTANLIKLAIQFGILRV